ncbi:putative 4-hydroxy-2-oxoheptanedioate aldolase [Helianthus annuus]|nr:putative 4-hydroxy-2-oxoheptanedioate aldolase [Helianthus annuus]
MSKLKLVYVQLQEVHIPYNPDKIRTTDELVLSNLDKLCKVRRVFDGEIKKVFFIIQNRYAADDGCSAFLLLRSSAHTVVRASDYGIDNGYLSNYEDELLIMCHVESEEGVKKIEEIAMVDRVDCVQMGPLDLSASMGYLWDPRQKKVKEVLRTAEKGVLRTMEKGGGAFLSGFAMPHDRPEEMRLRWYHMISRAVDIGLFRSARVEDV